MPLFAPALLLTLPILPSVNPLERCTTIEKFNEVTQSVEFPNTALVPFIGMVMRNTPNLPTQTIQFG